MPVFSADLGFATSITGPIFLLVFFGYCLKRFGVIDDSFIKSASQLVFKFGLPIVLFQGVYDADFQQAFNPALVAYCLFGTLLFFVVLSYLAPVVVENQRDFGVFIQAGFRGNLGIVGLAFALEVFGAAVLGVVSVLMASLTVLYNCLSVYTLNKSLQNNAKVLSKTLLGFVKNPLIIGIFLGFACNFFQVPIHHVFERSGDYIGRISLPLALICIGGALTFKGLSSSSMVLLSSVALKLVAMPLLLTLGAYWLGFSTKEVVIVFLMMATPTAVSSFTMVEAMHGNSALAARIIGFSTFFSMFSVTLGLLVLSHMGFL